MSYGYGYWPAYVSVAQRRANAAREIAKLRKKGRQISPVVIAKRKIATTFWGAAWCDNLESYRDYENRLPRGRSYVRNGSVMDLQIAPTVVEALVCGSSLYRVTIKIAGARKASWKSICADCVGGVGSLVELLQGRLSKAVMERMCLQGKGLFPAPSEISFSCSCPDVAHMCKHVAAALYGVGARLDNEPELLFRLRNVDARELLTDLDATARLAKKGPDKDKVLEGDDLSALFGLEMALDAPVVTPAAAQRQSKPARTRAAKAKTKPNSARKRRRTNKA